MLVDTSVWVAHFREPSDALIRLLERDSVLAHPLVIGEIACGTPPNRKQTLADLMSLQPVNQASLQEVLAFIEHGHLFGQGCGLIDLQLLASTVITPGARFWTLDKQLGALAERFNVSFRSIACR
ncbi:VapC toxin family PIN domain ribonuclease [Azomonas macrocytogenes]|uniref:type II toxin-antitoxin system VapC family toxin n=1 Tax=Azomonas macrocytogenes TaxID=69962 RepID=UPI0030844DC2